MDSIFELLNELKQQIEELKNSNKDFLTVDEAKEYLNLSKSCLYKLTSQKVIPYFNPGGKKIYFKKEDLDQWILSARVSPDVEVMQELSNELSNSNLGTSW